MTKSSADCLIALYLVTFMALAWGCGGNEPRVEMSTTDSAAVKSSADFTTLLFRCAIDRRYSRKLEATVEHPDAKIRALAGLTIGRIPSSRVEPLIQILMDDRDPVVRRTAAFSVALRKRRASRELVDAVSSRLDKEPNPEARAALIHAFGNIAEPKDVDKIISELGSGGPTSAAALLAFGRMVERGIAPTADGINKACALTASQDERTRLAAAYLLSVPSPEPLDASCAASLTERLVSEPSAEVRIQLAKALTAAGPASTPNATILLRQPDYRVAASALNALEHAAPAYRCSQIDAFFRGLEKRAAPNAEKSTPPHAQIVTAALTAAFTCPEMASTRAAASRLTPTLLAGDPLPPGRRFAGCLSLAAAGKDDLEVMSCDPSNGAVGKQIYIERLKARRSADPETEAILLDFTNDSEFGVARAALRALSALNTPTAANQIVEHLSDSRIPLVVEAQSAVIARPKRFMGQSVKIVSALNTLIERGKRFSQLVLPMMLVPEVLVSLADPDTAAPLMTRLMKRRNPVIRDAVISAMIQMDLPTPKKPPLTGSAADSLVARIVSHHETRMELIIDTAAGAIVAALDSAHAPMGVDTLLHLGRNRYYDGQHVETVVPGEGVYIGLPAGMGGDARDLVELEPSEAPVKRGTVAFRHTDAAKTDGHLFIALHRMPELDGKVTVVGQLISGDAVLDQLAPGTEVGSASLSGVK